jgi:alkylhydroperoxidase family enzyme
MYLEDLLEARRSGEAGRFGRVIEASRRQGTQAPGIYYLFAARPEAAPHLGAFMQEVMRGSSELSPGQRELIAAFVSARNQCLF